MRRWQTVRQYRSRGVADDAEVQMNAAESRDLLVNRRHLDDMSRLMLEIAVRQGDGVMTFAELKKMAINAVADAGTIKAAIEALARKRKSRASK
jgi:hypothetical protein